MEEEPEGIDDPDEGGSVEPDGASERIAARVASLADGTAGWTGPKVALLVVVASLVAVVLALTLFERFDSPPEDSVDVGFVRDMIVHHEQAVQLGILGSDNGSDHDVRHFALEAIIAQQYEIGYMDSLLDEWGVGVGDRDRDVMVWMDMPTSIENMPGMASDEDMQAFRSMSGAEADAAFLSLMTEHHRGGVHMAEYAAEHAKDPRVVDLAERMVRNQRAEIQEYAVHAERLGVTL